MRTWVWLVLLAFLLHGCGFVRPYAPDGGQLLQKEGRLKLFEASGRFVVVETFQMADPRNEVCVFETRADAEEYYDRLLNNLPVRSPFECPCGESGRQHPGDSFYNPEVNQRCEAALDEG